MYHHAARLVDHDDVIVLIDNIQRDILRDNLSFLRLRQFDPDFITGSCLCIFPERCTCQRDTALLHQILNRGARQLRQLFRKQLVQPLSRVRRIYLNRLPHLCSISSGSLCWNR